ncbi:sugar-binding transcriptional regulator [Branchiibius sp. NY16-3462-2]|uniref:sugar-binding transcriptional regulator n=1 Tax=Branchiibius sp. NY16-3462-2 TaxID=1807500 RepID=UPI000795FD8A|nr:sugar-binding domain-containing protein [Branchiibius sp. NY16-3462-2]KYH45165.1 hypothetical protein AZH51_14900 [Branchiibius sp. NY16-3462-2]
MTKDRRGPAELVLTATVARKHYLQGRSKVEIADELGLSRFKVARLLDAAIETGIVRFEIVAAGDIDLDRSARLQERYGLRHAIVLDSARLEPETLPEAMGTVAAQALSEILEPGDVLGLPWSRSVLTMARALADHDLPPVDVVQISGAMAVPGYDTSAVDIVRRAARASGGHGAIFYAPLLLDDADNAANLRREPQVAEVLAQGARVTVAVVGIGAWAPGDSTLYDAACDADREAVRAAGAVGEFAGTFFDVAGRPLRTPLSDRIIAISAEHLGQVREVIGIATGESKRDAVRAAFAGGILNAVVTDAVLADALLAD